MLEKILRILIATLFLSVASCGPDDSSSSSLNTIDSKYGRTPFIIALSGWNTCAKGETRKYDPNGTIMWEPTIKLRNELRNAYKTEPVWFNLCYTFWKQRVTGKGRYLSSNNPEKYLKASPEKTVEIIREMISKIKNPDVHIVGFSYGGWLAIKLAHDLAGTVNIPTLTTLDPVSQYDCNMLYFLAGYLFGGTEGCTRFPTDLELNTLTNAKIAVGSWTNYYQANYKHIHSGETHHADLNHKIETGMTSAKAHGHMVRSPGIWNAITDRIWGEEADTEFLF
jgi:hypothetical protein